MKRYMEPMVAICELEKIRDVLTTSIGTSNDNNYSDIDWELG